MFYLIKKWGVFFWWFFGVNGYLKTEDYIKVKNTIKKTTSNKTKKLNLSLNM